MPNLPGTVGSQLHVSLLAESYGTTYEADGDQEAYVPAIGTWKLGAIK